MVLDTLDHSSTYEHLHPFFAAAFNHMKSLPSAPAIGRTDVMGNLIYALVAEAHGKSADASPLEAHQKYIDIHLCIGGCEKIGWRPSHTCRSVDTPYNDEKDIMTFRDQPQTWIDLAPGTFAIFFPEDAHAPMISDGIVRKVVMKVLVDASVPK